MYDNTSKTNDNVVNKKIYKICIIGMGQIERGLPGITAWRGDGKLV